MDTTTTATRPAFTKLRNGDWGVKGPAVAIVPDEAVTVTKRDGTTKVVIAAAVVWTDGEVAIASLAPERNQRSTRRDRPECTECGAHGPAGHQCRECYEGHFS